MNKTSFKSDKNKLTVTRTFDAPIDLVWRAWTEKELLDKWWAPTPYKSETSHMDFREGGYRLYAMVGPKGEKHWGRTGYTAIHKPTEIEGDDAFCDENGTINEAFPVATFTNEYIDKGNQTEVVIVTEYASEEALKQVLDMGMKEGLTMTFEQLDMLLKDMDQ